MRLSSLLIIMYLAVPASAWLWDKKKKKEDNNNSNKETGDQRNMVAEPFTLSPVSSTDGVPMVHLHNEVAMPLVGLGVEYLPPYLVPLLTASALQQDKKIRLFDTAHVTGNEALLANGIQQGLERIKLEEGEKIELHVITKVWYTHLGYHRTQISVKESFSRLSAAVANDDRVDLKVHILLQWPRCYETIDWMNCEEDESTLASHVQEAGPPPHQDKENAWKGSWKALEDMYLGTVEGVPPIASIGVANFHLKDLQEMDQMGDEIRVHPHIMQISVWSLLYDPLLVDYCSHKGIHLQVVDAIDGILADPSRTKNAHHHLLKVAEDMEDGVALPDQDELTPTQVVLTWLIQQGVSVIPGPERLSELQENSALTLSAMPQLTHNQVETVSHCVEAYISGDDLKKDVHSFVTFTAKNKDAMLYWQKPDGGESKIAFIGKGKSFNETTYPKHQFRIYDARNKDNYIDYQVEARFGEHITYDAYLN